MTTKKERVFLIDDHPIVRQGLAVLIDQEPDLAVCGTAADARSALDGVLKSKPNIVVVDLSMPGPDGLEFIKNLHVHMPKLPVLVLSMHDEMLYAERALKAGAQGYIMKHEAETNIMAAIRRVLQGEVYLSLAMTGHLLRKVADQSDTKPISQLETLADRELQVFEHIGRGYRSVEIAEQLGISIKTVESHVSRIRQKLGLRNSHEVARQAVIWVQQKLGRK